MRRDRRLYKVKRAESVAGRYSFETFEEYVASRWDYAYRTAAQIIDAADAVEKMRNCAGFMPVRESHVRPLLRLDADDERAAVWQGHD